MEKPGVEISAQQVLDMVQQISECCPAIDRAGAPIDVMIDRTMQVAGGILNEVRELTIKGDGLGIEAALAYMCIGAQAAFCDNLGPQDLPRQLYYAGRAVGTFMAQRMAEVVRLRAEPNPQ